MTTNHSTAPSQNMYLPAQANNLWSWRYVLLVLLCTAATMALRASRSYGLPMFDLYPLYYGNLAWWRTGNAYDLLPVVPSAHVPFQMVQIGNGYPFPALVLVSPLSMLPPTVASILWIGLMTAGLMLVLRLNRLSLWFLGYLPLLEGWRIEQYTTLIVILQLLALWAYRERRAWLLALCCALIMTKPQHGLFFALALACLAKHWRQQLIVGGIVWGGTWLLDPSWPQEWLVAVQQYDAVAQQPTYWLMALLAIPVLWCGDILTATLIVQQGLFPYPGVYASSALPLNVLGERRSPWLLPIAFVWPLITVSMGKGWATTLTLVLPVVVLVVVKRFNQTVRKRGSAAQSTPPDHALAPTSAP